MTTSLISQGRQDGRCSWGWTPVRSSRPWPWPFPAVRRQPSA